MSEADRLILDFRIHDANKRWEEKVLPHLDDLRLNPDINPGKLMKRIAERIKAKNQK